MFKLENHGQFLIFRIGVLLGNLWSRPPSFSHREQILITKGRLIHFLQVRMEHGTIADDFLIWDLTDHIDHIHTEATNSLINPEIHHVIDLMTEFLIFPVEIWLLLTKVMQVVLT